MSTKRMLTPRSSSARQGETLASWSRWVSRISSPGPSSRPMERLMAKVSVVMLGPKTTSSGSLPKKSAMADRASARNGIGALAGGVCATGVGVRVRQVIADGVNDTLRNLGTARAIEEDRRLSRNCLRQRRELSAHPGNIERSGSVGRCNRHKGQVFVAPAYRRVSRARAALGGYRALIISPSLSYVRVGSCRSPVSPSAGGTGTCPRPDTSWPSCRCDRRRLPP